MANFTFDKPFQIELADKQLFTAEKVVRILPKRRLVAFGTWAGKPVVAKLFFSSKHAARHIEKDAAGIQALQKNIIPTPALYYQGTTSDRGIQVLIYERILHAESLAKLWAEKTSVDEILPQLEQVVIEIATQHVLGVLQQDLHLGNFLCTEKTIYTLDGAQVECFPHLLNKKTSMNNLALFLSQFGVGMMEYQEKLFNHYARARGWRLKKEDFRELFFMIRTWNNLRWKRYEQKIFRDCTDFTCLKNWRSFGVYDRAYGDTEFLTVINNPESAFSHPRATYLKKGRSSTVVKLTLDNRELVIKRYNMKNAWHLLRRCLRITRAHECWRLAQKLQLFGVLTAKPVAFIERKTWKFHGKSYYITEYISAENIDEYFAAHVYQEVATDTMIKRVTTLLRNLAKLQITHGDLKKTNILVNAKQQPVLIDLDGAAEHASLSSLRSAWGKEIRRFLRNFDAQTTILEKFKSALR